MSTATMGAATVPATLDIKKPTNAVADSPPIPAAFVISSGRSRYPSIAIRGSTTHSTIITFDFAKPISSSRSISRVGDLVAMASLDVLGKQIVEVRLDQPDLADLAATREGLLDRGVDHRICVRAL